MSSRPLLLAAALAVLSLPLSAAADEVAFASCLAKLRGEAAAKGVRGETFDTHTVALAPDMAVIGFLDAQPEFVTPIWDYLAALVDEERVADGRAMLTQWKEVLAEVERRYGRLDVLVNNAGIGAAPNDGYDKFYERMAAMNEQLARGETPTVHLDHIIDMQDDGWQKVIDINLNGMFYNCREAVRLMIKCGAKGSIVNISSTSGLNGTGAVHYCASKAAVLGVTKSLARELGSRGIRVNAICPGATNTRMMAGISPDYAKQMLASIPLGRMGEPAEVASTALFLASDRSAQLTGQTLAANGGWHML